MDDAGMFQCFAVNKAGEDSISVWLKVKSTYALYCLISVYQVAQHDSTFESQLYLILFDANFLKIFSSLTPQSRVHEPRNRREKSARYFADGLPSFIKKTLFLYIHSDVLFSSRAKKYSYSLCNCYCTNHSLIIH